MNAISSCTKYIGEYTARAASFLFTCCSSVSRIIICMYAWKKKKTNNKTYSDKIMELAKARKFTVDTDNLALPV